MPTSKSSIDFLHAVSGTPRFALSSFAPLQGLLGEQWRTIFGSDALYSVAFDALDVPNLATRAAAKWIVIHREFPEMLREIRKHVRNAMIHNVAQPDAVAIVGDTVHFFEVKYHTAIELRSAGQRLYQELSAFMQQERPTEPKCVALLCWVVAPPDQEVETRDAVRAAFGDLARLEWLEQQAPVADLAEQLDDWSDALNQRRCALIDKEIEGTLTDAEQAELSDLQDRMLRHRRRVAPLPITDAQRLLDELSSQEEAQR